MQKSIPMLWFDKNAEEAIESYNSVFENSSVKGIERYPEGPLEGPIE